jgi:hypothetical protein
MKIRAVKDITLGRLHYGVQSAEGCRVNYWVGITIYRDRTYLMCPDFTVKLPLQPVWTWVYNRLYVHAFSARK